MGEREGDRDSFLLLLWGAGDREYSLLFLWGAGDQDASLLSLRTGLREAKLRRLAMGERERDLRLRRERERERDEGDFHSPQIHTHLLGIGDLEYDRLRLLIGERE